MEYVVKLKEVVGISITGFEFWKLTFLNNNNVYSKKQTLKPVYILQSLQDVLIVGISL